MSFREIIEYYESNNLNMVDDKLGEMIPNYCFLVTYTYALLTEGYGFQLNQPITVLDQVRVYVCMSIVCVSVYECIYSIYAYIVYTLFIYAYAYTEMGIYVYMHVSCIHL